MPAAASPARAKRRRIGLLAAAAVIAAGLFVAGSGTAALAAPRKSAQLDGSWQKTFDLLRNTSDPVAQKLVTWLYASETRVPAEPRALMAFIEENPDWPRLHAIRRKVENDIAGSGLTPAEIASWFDAYPPLGYDGIRAYLDALLRLDQTTRARAALADFWNGAELSRNQVSTLASSYKNIFAKGAMAARLDHLIWEGRYAEADAMLAFVGADVRALGYARMALARQAPDANSALAKVPAALRNDEGLAFERMRYRRRKDPGDSALEMLFGYKGAKARPDVWWNETHIMARRAIERRDYRAAKRIAANHQLKSGAEFASAEWLLGWINLRFLNDPVAAYRHFDGLYRNVNSAVSRSRAAYWAAAASEKLKEMPTAAQWHRIAAYYPSTFYGQLSYLQLNGTATAAVLGAAGPDAVTTAAFEKKELVRAILLLHKVKLTRTADPFFTKLLSQATTRADFQLIARLAKQVDRPYYAIDANKQAQQNIGAYMLDEGYPLLKMKPPAAPESALIHAIIHRESMFDPKAQSTAGARGLMQLMPGTAQALARKTKRAYKVDMLTEQPAYNVALGSAYLDDLIERYDGFYPMAIAAYNAGPGRVTEWIRLFGDPRLGQIDVLDWVEHIPIYETRNYVQRVMESYFLYRVKLGQPPRVITDFAPQPTRR